MQINCILFMESLREKIKSSLNENLRKKDETAVSTLRLVLAAIKDSDIEFRTKKKGELIGDDDILSLLINMVKQRKESVEIYSKAGRKDLSQREAREIEIIKSFLPRQIKSSELEEIIKNVISEMNYSSIKDLGNLIKTLKEKYPGQLDMKEVAEFAKKTLK